MLCLEQLILQDPLELWPSHTSLDGEATHSFNPLHVLNQSKQ
jgi:hypothetical protein